MAAGFLTLSGPPELLVRIFKACESTTDVRALAATCRYTRGVWHSNAPSIIWQLWPREVVCFDEALVAVRATRLIVTAEARGKRPPTEIPLDDLTGHSHRPNTVELQSILDVHHLANALQVAFYHHDGRWPFDLSSTKEPPSVPPEEPDRMPVWTAQMHRAIYRTLIAGASLVGPYSESLFRDESEDGGMDWARTQKPPLETEQLEHLEKLSPYNVTSSQQEDEAIFGSLAKWLLQNILADDEGRAAMAQRFEKGIGRAQICQNRTDCAVKLREDGAGGSNFGDSDAHFVVWQVMQMIWVVFHTEQAMLRRFVNDPESISSYNLGHGPLADRVSAGPLKSGEGRSRRVAVALYGIFKAEVVTMPELIAREREPTIRVDETEAAARAGDLAEKDVYYISPYLPAELTVRRLLDYVYASFIEADDTSAEDGGSKDSVPPLTLKFFQYFLGKYLGLGFASDIWVQAGDAGDAEDESRQFLNQFTLFSLDDTDGRDCGSGDIIDNDYLDGSEFLTTARGSA